MKKMDYQGVVVPTVTPFLEDGNIDREAVGKLIGHITDNQCHPFVLGTTGEAQSLSARSCLQVLESARDANSGKKTLYAGIASTCLEDSVTRAREYISMGADVLVAHLPAYYPLPESYMYRYFMELADRIPGPLMIYNIKATTHMSIPVEVVLRLSEHPNIVGLKDSERDVERMETLLDHFSGDPGFAYQLGWAAMSTDALLKGADGIVPSTGNAFPGLYYKLYEACKKGDETEARKYQDLTADISAIYQKDRLLSESLSSLKVILEELGICNSFALAPCYEPDPQEIQNIRTKIKPYLELA